MREERHWLAVVSAQRYADERLYAFDALVLPGAAGQVTGSPSPGDPVALVAVTEPPVLFGLGLVAGLRYGPQQEEAVGDAAGVDTGGIRVSYTHRLFDEPLSLPQVEPLLRLDHASGPGLRRVTAAEFQRFAGRVGANRHTDADAKDWFVSLALPIEASSPAEAVREFWTYVQKLGPRELPAYVWPRGDELAMQAYLLGGPANLDPEENDENR